LELIRNGSISDAFKLYFKPELWSINCDRTAGECRSQIYVSPLIKMAKKRAGSLISKLTNKRSITRAKLMLKKAKQVFYMWKMYNTSDFIKQLLPPYWTTGRTVTKQHVMQYNGQIQYNVSDSCQYLLAHETQQAKFSVIMFTGDANIVDSKKLLNPLLIQASNMDGSKNIHLYIEADGTVYIEGDNTKMTPSGSKDIDTFKLSGGSLTSTGKLKLNTYADSDIDYANTMIMKKGNMTKIVMCKSFGGLMIKCFPNKGYCVFTVPGKYFSKVIGLFGKNNYESGAVNKKGERLTPDKALDEWSLTKCSKGDAWKNLDVKKAEKCEVAVEKADKKLCGSFESNSIEDVKKMCWVPKPDECSIIAAYSLSCDWRASSDYCKTRD